MSGLRCHRKQIERQVESLKKQRKVKKATKKQAAFCGRLKLFSFAFLFFYFVA